MVTNPAGIIVERERDERIVGDVRRELQAASMGVSVSLSVKTQKRK